MQKKFIFIHIPKTGGNSIQNVLRNYSKDKIIPVHKGDKELELERFQVVNPKYDFKKHSTLQKYRKGLGSKTFHKYFKFSTIRNPWDRMISCYFSPHRDVRKWDRDEFIQMVKGGVRPMRYYLLCSCFHKRLLKTLKLGRFCRRPALDRDIDFLMRFEHLEEDFHQVCDILDIPFSPLPCRNQSRRKPYQHYYDEELDALIRSRFQDEIDFGGYEL